MKINVLLKTFRNLGDHGKEISVAVSVSPDDTVSDIIKKNMGIETNAVYECLEIRLVQDD